MSPFLTLAHTVPMRRVFLQLPLYRWANRLARPLYLEEYNVPWCKCFLCSSAFALKYTEKLCFLAFSFSFLIEPLTHEALWICRTCGSLQFSLDCSGNLGRGNDYCLKAKWLHKIPHVYSGSPSGAALRYHLLPNRVCFSEAVRSGRLGKKKKKTLHQPLQNPPAAWAQRVWVLNKGLGETGK